MTSPLKRLLAYSRGYLAAGVLIAAGCSQNRGPATRAYLKAEQDAVAAFAAGIGHESTIEPPRKPVLPSDTSEAERQAFGAALTRYRKELTITYTIVIDRLSRQSSALERVQAAMEAIDETAVDPDAVRLMTAEEGLFNAERLMILEASLVYNRQRGALMQEQQPNFYDDICVSAARRAMEAESSDPRYWSGDAWSSYSGLADAAGKSAEERGEIEGWTAHFSERQSAARRAAIAFQAERSRVLAALSARYPGQDLDF